MNTAELRTKDVAGLQEEIKDLQRAHFGLAHAKSHSATRQHAPRCAKRAAALLAPRPFLLKSNALQTEIRSDHDGS
jgi:large subunit ribosomal protein L29